MIDKEEVIYADFDIRLRAAIIDESLLIAFSMILLTLLIRFNIEYPISIVLVFFFLFEPLITYYCGNTIAQSFYGIKIVSEQADNKPSLFRLFVRFILKFFGGLISMIYMLFTNKRQSMHDLAAKTLVIISKDKLVKNPSLIKYTEVEILDDNENYINPRPIRKFFVFILWYLVISILLIPVDTILELLCECKLDYFIDFYQIIIFISLAYLASEGRLIGAKKKKRIVNEI